MTRLNVLVTNDDGINSPGIWKIAEAISEIANVVMVAPDRDQSGKGSSITLLNPLNIERQISKVSAITEVYTVDGTPADCVIVATEEIFPNNIDLVISGINQGANVGLDVFTSGTFGAALHGYCRDIDSIALSVFYGDDIFYDPAVYIGRQIVSNIINMRLAKSDMDKMLLNINFPNCDLDEIDTIESTFIGPRLFSEGIEKVNRGRRDFYWLKNKTRESFEPEKGTDVWAITNQKVSVTLVDPYFPSSTNQFAIDQIINTVSK
ncbi:MAG: 5'/3'-nucleotidase SurE [Dehalococcoidia bacterium]